MDQLAELFKFAFEGAPFKTYACLNLLALWAHRYAGISTRVGWMVVAATGAIWGGWAAYIEAMAEVGVIPTVLYNAAFTGAILGAGGATVVGIPLALILDKSGILPQTVEKKVAEAYRDPENPATPSALEDVEKTTDELGKELENAGKVPPMHK